MSPPRGWAPPGEASWVPTPLALKLSLGPGLEKREEEEEEEEEGGEGRRGGAADCSHLGERVKRAPTFCCCLCHPSSHPTLHPLTMMQARGNSCLNPGASHRRHRPGGAVRCSCVRTYTHGASLTHVCAPSPCPAISTHMAGTFTHTASPRQTHTYHTPRNCPCPRTR